MTRELIDPVVVEVPRERCMGCGVRLRADDVAETLKGKPWCWTCVRTLLPSADETGRIQRGSDR